MPGLVSYEPTTAIKNENFYFEGTKITKFVFSNQLSVFFVNCVVIIEGAGCARIREIKKISNLLVMRPCYLLN